MWITSEAARMDVHAHRSTVDAVIVGVGTVLADNPQLTARNLRDGSLAIRQPLRVVVDSEGRTPPDARVRDRAAPTWVATAAELGVTPRTARWTSPTCWRSCTSGTCGPRCWRAGPRLAGAFLAAGLVDRVVGYLAPKLLGAGPAALVDAGVTTVADAIELEFIDIARVGTGPAGHRRAPVREGLSMFTGIVEELGEVVAHQTRSTDRPGAAGRPATPASGIRSRSTGCA